MNVLQLLGLLVLAVALLALVVLVVTDPRRARRRREREAQDALRPMGTGRLFWLGMAEAVGRGIAWARRTKDRARGRAVWAYELIGPDGKVREAGQLGQNLIVNAGLDLVKDRLHNPLSILAGTTHMGIGTGAIPEVAGDVALGTEIAPARAAVTYTAGGVGACVLEVTYPAAGGYEPASITEAGLFNAAALGTLFNRKVFPVVVKQATDQLKVTCSITWTSL